MPPARARRGARRAKFRKKAVGGALGRTAVSREDSDGPDDNESDTAEDEEEQRQNSLSNLWHFVVLLVLLICYGLTISVHDSNRELLSACWREILGELRPDEPKSAERITEGEVVPQWAEFLHADDVTKHLNWFQTFCKFKNGMDDHLEFQWRCNMIKVDLDWPVHAEPLAPYMNCTRDFITNHIIKGDDPRCVPWANSSLELLQKLESAQQGYASKVGSVEEIYDEYTVREGNPMWETVDEGFDEIDSRLESIEAGIEKFVADDRESQTRRLPEKGLAACPDMRCPWRGVNDDREPEDVPCDCFDYGLLAIGTEAWKSKRTCRNHHWGLMHLCQPRRIVVSFYIERVDIHKNVTTKEGQQGEERSRVLWFLVEMEFEDLLPSNLENTPSGWYRTYLHLKQGEFYGFKGMDEGIVAALTVLMLICVLFREAFWTIQQFPSNVKHLLALREPSVVAARIRALEGDDAKPSLESVRWLFEQSALQLTDGRGVRREYMSPASMVLENVVIVCTFIGFVRSAFDWNKVFIPREYDTSERISPASYIMGLQGDKILTEMIFEIFFDDTPWHGLAWILLYFRTLAYFLQSIPGLRWIPVSLTLASVRVMYFFLAYGLLILGFGILAHLQFGQRFVQFSCLQRACLELLFLSCGFPGYVFEDIFPYEDGGSWLAISFLAVYVVVAVTLGLNFFTTIVLDAYNLAINPDGPQQVLDESWVSISDMLMSWLGIELDLYDDVDENCSDDMEDSHGTGVGRDSESSVKPRQSHSSKRVSEVEMTDTRP